MPNTVLLFHLGASLPTGSRSDAGWGPHVLGGRVTVKDGCAECGFVERDRFTRGLDPQFGLDTRHRASLPSTAVTVPAMLTNRSAPPATVTPVLIYPDVRAAVAWLEAAFGFEERVRIGDSHRAQLRVGSDGAVVVADVRGDQVAPGDGVVTHLLKVRVPDVDAAFARARDCGARVVEELRTYEYGERSGVLEDLGGHRWDLTQTMRDTAPEEWGGTTIAPW